jgi:multiple sugar transport system substrate-binding protein
LTWDDFFAAGKKLKAKGHPIGQALGHSLGDPPGFAYPYMWSYGAMEVDKDGKTVAFNKPEFVDAVKRFVQAWKDGFDETALSGDDSYNNRAFAADQISVTYNGSSVYVGLKKDNPKLAEDTDHMLIPKGPAGRFYMLGAKSMGIFKKSKNVEGGKAFWKWWFDEKQYGEWFRLQEGYQLAPTQKWASDPLWDADPKIWAYKEQVKYGRDFGWAGTPGEKPVLVWSKYIVVDTLAKAIQGGDAAAAVKWGADELQKIYGG